MSRKSIHNDDHLAGIRAAHAFGPLFSGGHQPDFDDPGDPHDLLNAVTPQEFRDSQVGVYGESPEEELLRNEEKGSDSENLRYPLHWYLQIAKEFGQEYVPDY